MFGRRFPTRRLENRAIFAPNEAEHASLILSVYDHFDVLAAEFRGQRRRGEVGVVLVAIVHFFLRGNYEGAEGSLESDVLCHTNKMHKTP